MDGKDDTSEQSVSDPGSNGGAAAGQNKAPRHIPSTSKETPVIARRKITRSPRLESVSESEISSNVDSPSSSSEFGVRSYLHNFYEADPGVKNKDEFFVDDDNAARSGQKSACGNPYTNSRWRSRCSCAALWWKAGVFVGTNILVLAVLALLLGYLIQPRQEVVDSRADVAVLNQDNVAFNQKLDAAKLAGLIMLCAGGFVVAISLLVPSLVSSTSRDSLNPDEFLIDPDGRFPPYMPLQTDDDAMMEDGIPYTSELSNVQPERADSEAIIAGNGMVKVQSS
ncbi:uncharacterized protein [Diadema antillarum]|uniref:uncharacterized protein n=1 Tax=Diadema antillarum TaxID=105358 RepID=UPI003A85B552